MSALVDRLVDLHGTAACSVGRQGSERLRSLLVREDDLYAYMAEFRERGVSTVVPPAIGEPWLDQGGLYVGVSPSASGDRHLVVHPDPRHYVSWDEAFAWARELGLDGHTDYMLPTREELALILANLRRFLKPTRRSAAPFWTSEQRGDMKAYVLSGESLFDSLWKKTCEFSACAVRRVRA